MLSHGLCGHYPPLGRLRMPWILAHRHHFQEIPDMSDKPHFHEGLESRSNSRGEYRVAIFARFLTTHIVREKSTICLRASSAQKQPHGLEPSNKIISSYLPLPPPSIDLLKRWQPTKILANCFRLQIQHPHTGAASSIILTRIDRRPTCRKKARSLSSELVSPVFLLRTALILSDDENIVSCYLTDLSS